MDEYSFSQDIYDYADTDSEGECDYPKRHSIAIFNCTLTAFGLLSSTVLIAILVSKSQLRATSYTFLNFLILAFVLKLLLNGSTYTEQAFDPCWRIGRPMCMVIKIAEPIITYSIVVFLIAVAFEQCNRYGTGTNRGPGTPQGLRLFMTFILVLLLSTPDIINALSELSKPNQSIISCEAYEHTSLTMYIVLSSKRCFLEYILPLLVLYILVAVIGIRMMRSRVTAPIQTTHANRRPPRYFALLVAIILAYTVGYFPRYAYIFAHILHRIFHLGFTNSEFLGHLHTVDRLFALIPPAFLPLFVFTLSRSHLDSGKEMFYRLKVRMSGRGWRSNSMVDTNGEEEEPINIGMEQLGHSSK